MRPRRKNNVGLRQRQNFGVVWSSQNHFSLVSFFFPISKAISSSFFYISTHYSFAGFRGACNPGFSQMSAIRLLMLRSFQGRREE